jgi:hypothetical protein
MNDLLITDCDIQALVDNELDPARHEQVLNALEHDPLLRRRYHELQRQKMVLLSWWADEQDRHH